MKFKDGKQVYHVLQNLSNLESSFIEFSNHPKDFYKTETYFKFYHNSFIENHGLARFYFPDASELPPKTDIPSLVSKFGTLRDYLVIRPDYYFAMSKSFNFPNALRHKCNYFTGIYMMEGTGSLKLDTRSFQVKPGDFYILPPDVYYALQSNPGSICIYFDMRRSFIASEYRNIFQNHPIVTDFFAQAISPDSSQLYLVFHTAGDEQKNDFVLNIFKEYMNQDKYSSSIMYDYLLLLFAYILRDTETTIDSSAGITRTDQKYEEILSYLETNYPTATLLSTAETIHISRQYICRIVKQKTGNTFNQLLNAIKLKAAAHYLAETSLTLENIAELCGFSSASYLSKVYKKQFGVSPSHHRDTM